MIDSIKVLDHGYVRLIEHYGKGDAGIDEAGIIEAARQSTQGSFRSWSPYTMCEECGFWKNNTDPAVYSTYCTSGNEHVWKEYPRGDEGLLSFLYSGKPQHATPFEFCGGILEVQAPIFVFREWHRHRTQSYNEMSARYAPLPDLNYVPTVERCFLTSTKNKQAGVVKGSAELTAESCQEWIESLKATYAIAEMDYQDGLKRGIPKEIARVCLPVGRYSRMRANANLRNWLAFLTLRADPQAQWEIQQYANAVGSIIEQCFPRTWKLFELARKG